MIVWVKKTMYVYRRTCLYLLFFCTQANGAQELYTCVPLIELSDLVTSKNSKTCTHTHTHTLTGVHTNVQLNSPLLDNN